MFTRLRDQCSLPRPLQCLYSQWRTGQVLSVGPFARQCGLVTTPICSLCQGPIESCTHLLSNCPGSHPYCQQHDLSLLSLMVSTPANMLEIARFDIWLRRTLRYTRDPPATHTLCDALAIALTMTPLSQPSKRASSATSPSELSPDPHPHKKPRLRLPLLLRLYDNEGDQSSILDCLPLLLWFPRPVALMSTSAPLPST